MEDKFKVRMRVAQWPSKTPVFHKQDGKRFAHPNTLKVRANHRYLVEAFITPPHGRCLTGMRIWGQTVLLTPLQDHHHPDLARYSALWSTSGYDVNKDTTRTFVPIILEFREEAMLLTTVQCKVYPGDGDGGHYQWGQALYSIDLDCKAPPDTTYVRVINDRFISSRTF